MRSFALIKDECVPCSRLVLWRSKVKFVLPRLGGEGTAEIKGAIFVQKNVQFSSAAGPLVQ